MDAKTFLAQVRRFDDQRPPLPGEHWLSFAAGVVLLRSGGRGSLLGRAASVAVGGALLYRAVSGRHGLRELLRGENEFGRQNVKLGGTVVASTAEPLPAAPLGIDLPADAQAEPADTSADGSAREKHTWQSA